MKRRIACALAVVFTPSAKAQERLLDGHGRIGDGEMRCPRFCTDLTPPRDGVEVDWSKCAACGDRGNA